MTSKAQQTRANRMLAVIERDKIINKFDLMDLCGLSLANYNQLSAWFKHRYQDTLHMVEYDKDAKNWKWQEKEIVTKQKRLNRK